MLCNIIQDMLDRKLPGVGSYLQTFPCLNCQYGASGFALNLRTGINLDLDFHCIGQGA